MALVRCQCCRFPTAKTLGLQTAMKALAEIDKMLRKFTIAFLTTSFYARHDLCTFVSPRQFESAKPALTWWWPPYSQHGPLLTNSASMILMARRAGGLSRKRIRTGCAPRLDRPERRHHTISRLFILFLRASGSRNIVWMLGSGLVMRNRNFMWVSGRAIRMRWALAIYWASGISCGCETGRLICIVDFLDYPGLRVVRFSKETAVYLVDAVVDSAPTGCLECGRLPNFLQKHGTKQREIADTPVRGLQVRIRLHRQRYICVACGATTFQPLPGIAGNKRMTTRLSEYIAQRATTQTFRAVAEETGQSEKTVRIIFKEHASNLLANRRPETPRCLGMDDVYVGRVARCVLVDNDRKCLYDLLPQRHKRHIYGYLVRIPGRNRIEVVTIDMWTPFRDAIREALEHAVIVVDRFHIQRALNNVPKKVARDFAPRRKPGKGFSRDSFLLVSSSDRLNGDERAKRDVWLSDEPLVREAYQIKERLLNVWQIRDRAKAESVYDRLVGEIPSALQGSFNAFTTSMKNWRAEIFNYWDYPSTNALAESTNNIIKNIQRAGKSYDFGTVREKALCRDVLRNNDRNPHRGISEQTILKSPGDARHSAGYPHGKENYRSPVFNANFLNPEARSEDDPK